MKVAPIIHTRTFSCDFNSEFLVRPEHFMDSDIKWARKNVLGATGEIDGLQGVRWLIADNGKYRMAGVVGFLKSICAKCQLSEDDRMKSETLFCDDKGRLIYAFIGVIIDKHHNIDCGYPSIDYLWGIYLNEIYPLWKRTFQEVILKDFTDINAKSSLNEITIDSIEAGSKILYEANAVTDYELFSDFVCDGSKTDFSFCSNILDFNMVKQSEFTIVTTSQNIITRITRENVVKPTIVLDEQSSHGMTSTDKTESPQIPETKKKSIVVLTIGLTILVIIILLLLLTKKMGSDQNTGQQVSYENQSVETISQIQSQEPAETVYML